MSYAQAKDHYDALDDYELVPEREEDMQVLMREEDQDGQDENQDELQDVDGNRTLHGVADAFGPFPPDSLHLLRGGSRGGHRGPAGSQVHCC